MQAGGTEPLRGSPREAGGTLRRGGNCKLCPCDWYNIVSVDIQPKDAERGQFGVLPRRTLKGFDCNDRKFVATAVAAQKLLKATVPIVNAVDSDYVEHLDALRALGVRVEFLCPEMQPPNAESAERP